MDPARPLILQYHQVGSPLAGGTWVTPRQFRTHLRWLQKHGYPFPRKPEDVWTWLHHPHRGSVITFDDGLLGVFTHAFPALRSVGGVGVVFVVTAFLGRRVGWDASFGYPTYHLDREHLQILHRSGWLIGSHSHTHPDLRRLTPKERERELRISLDILEDLLEAPVRIFSYPFNRFDLQVMESVHRAGYRLAFAGYGGGTHPLARFRFGVYTPFLSLGWLTQGPPVYWIGRTIQRFAALSGWARHRWPRWMRAWIGMEEVDHDTDHRMGGIHQPRQDPGDPGGL